MSTTPTDPPAALAPCPLCGSAPDHDYGEGGIYEIWCRNSCCSAHLETWAGSRETAIAAWNRRALPTDHALVPVALLRSAASFIECETAGDPSATDYDKNLAARLRSYADGKGEA